MSADFCVLVVDDEPLLRDIVSEWLTMEGYSVLTAENGADALRMVERNRVHAIVTDIRMPVMDGITLLKTLKASSGYTPAVIFVSGFADILPREAFDLGAEMLLPKPFREKQLVGAVRRILTPREELWRSSAPPQESQSIQATFLTPEAARESGQIAFGRGGFCLWTEANLRGGPVRFELNFARESLRLAGHGIVRWVRASEDLIGVEIEGLEDQCLAAGIRLTAAGSARSYIPATTAPI